MATTACILAVAGFIAIILNPLVVYLQRPRIRRGWAVAIVTGVRNIKDEIQIGYDADPADVTLAVQEALDRYALIIDDSNVTVDTDGHTVTLSGHVPTLAEHDAVMNAAWTASGVYDVHDELHITD